VTSSGKDDDLDDPTLRSMRAVWISMRDEEPPSSGLAELLAAARVKAEEMQPREPWWQRIFAVMRQPPVLALATVVVLLGGAVVIGTRREAFEARPEAELAQDRGAGAAEELAAPAERARDSGERSLPAPDPAATPAGAAAAGSAAPSETTAVAPAPPSPPPKPAVRAVPRPPRVPAVSPRSGAGAGPGASGADRASAATPPPAGRPASKQDLQIADDGGDAAPAEATAGAAPERASGAGARVPVTSRPRGPTVTQLAKRAETAAARGDCAEVRAIVDRIRKLDAAFHASHVERNAAVKRCVK
jgi:hypothetical protein